MKLPALLVAGSLAANAALGVLFLLRSSPDDGSRTSAAAVAAGPGGIGPGVQIWPALLEGDSHGLVERLRAGGFPPDVIRAIVEGHLSDRFGARRLALTGPPEIVPFWRITGAGPLTIPQDPQTRAALLEFDRERRNLYEDLLGPDGLDRGAASLMAYRNLYGDLPLDKVFDLRRITADYNDLSRSIMPGVITPEGQEKLALLEKELRADLAAVLTPRELEEYDLRSSLTASILRTRLASFNPTEEEFRAAFRVQRALEEKQGITPVSVGSTVLTAARVALSTGPLITSSQGGNHPEVLAALQQVLSPERLEDFKVVNDPASANVSRITHRLGLPLSAARQVATVRGDIQQRAAAVRADRNLSPEHRNTQLAALAREATGRITEAIGPSGFDAYLEYAGGAAWFNSLQAAPAAR